MHNTPPFLVITYIYIYWKDLVFWTGLIPLGLGAAYIMSSLHHVTCQVVEVTPPEVENVVDTTGAEDAFLGDLIVVR